MTIMGLDAMLALKGSEIGVSEWIMIDQPMIDAFAAVTRDDQFQHVDHKRAVAAGFGSTIAHGMLTLSLFRAMYLSSGGPEQENISVAINYGLNKVRFIREVPVGTRVRGRFTLVDLMPRGADGFMQTLELVVEREGEAQPAMVAEFLILLRP